MWEMCWMQDSSTYFIYDRLSQILYQAFFLIFPSLSVSLIPFLHSPPPLSLLFFALLSASHIFSFVYLFFFFSMVGFFFLLLIFFSLSPKLGILFSLTMKDPFYIISIKITFVFPYFCFSQHLLMLGLWAPFHSSASPATGIYLSPEPTGTNKLPLTTGF